MTAPPLKKEVANCQNKRRYPDEVTALAAGAYSSIKTGEQGLYTYRCPECKGWHLTRVRGKRNQNDGKRWIFDYSRR